MPGFKTSSKLKLSLKGIEMKTSKLSAGAALVAAAFAMTGCASQPKISKFTGADERFVSAGTSSAVTLEQGATVRNRNEDNPAPVLFTLKNPKKFLRGETYDNASCNALGDAVGDLATGRIYVRLEKISCEDGSGRPLFSAEAEGYVYGADKSLGLPAKVETKDGRQTLTLEGDQAATLVITRDLGIRLAK